MMKAHTLKRILSYSKKYIFYLVFSLICAIISTLCALYIPILIGEAVDNIIDVNNVAFANLKPILFRIIMLAILGSITTWTMNISTNILGYSTSYLIRNDAFNKLHKLPLSYLDSNSKGDIINRIINDVESIQIGLIQGFQQLFSGIMTIIGTLIFMLSINVAIAVVVVIVTPISLLIASFIARGCHKMFKMQSEINGELNGFVDEMFSNQKIVKAFSYEKRSEERFNEINEKLKKTAFKAAFYPALTNPCTRFVNGLVYASVGIIGALVCINSGLVIGGVTIISGGISVGALTVFLNYANQYTKPFNEISTVVTELQNAFACAKRVFLILDLKEEADDGVEIRNVKGNVLFDNVSFSYDKSKDLIKNYNLSVNEGKRIAIVGPTGAGKSTIINLLMRFYDCDDGRILLDGKNINEVSRKSLRSNFGMVLQDTWIFEGTVFENIAYGKPNATLDEVISAAKKTHAHSFIERLPKGYDTIIKENGSISIGEKQLLCITRVMVNIPPVLILDEATSSIDTRTELKIQKSFEIMMNGHTSFIIAHRLSTIKNADLIIVMNRGSIVEEGTHEELLKKDGFYATLYNSQFKSR